MTHDMLDEATALANAEADLGSLIRFVRAHDPTARFREVWGADYQVRLDELLPRTEAAVSQPGPFTGSANELLLSMAHLVAAAPYLGLPEAQVQDRLIKLLGLLVQKLRNA